MTGLSAWLQSSLVRAFPSSSTTGEALGPIVMARSERASFQVCVRNESTRERSVSCEASAPDGVAVTVRLVGLVPVLHHNTETEPSELDGVGKIPGWVPDPLLRETSTVLGPYETRAFWVTVAVPEGATPGIQTIAVRLFSDGETVYTTDVALNVRETVNRGTAEFPVTHWFYADALCAWYGLEPFGERFWAVVRPYMRNLVEHGNTCQYVPIFTPPTDGVKRPTQLLRVSADGGRYTFDFTDVQHWVRLAREYGATFFEWTHLFTQWGARNAIRVYGNNADPASLLWDPDTEAMSATYRGFLGQFLPRFHAFLEEEGVLEASFFHLSDEPGEEHLASYAAARAMLKELAPWMKVADAMSHLRFGSEGLTDIPIPSISTAVQYRDAGIPSWAYFCCGPRGPYLNRLMDTPLAKIRMTGWLLHRLEARGFLHWGYNYWNRRAQHDLVDPFQETAAYAWPNWAYGDPFVVYPGADGPIDSIRWEIFAESLQDLGLLRTLGIASDDPVLGSIHDYAEFPKSSDWIMAARERLLPHPLLA